ncbi:A/G-specific adenine glycosylase [uncultured Sphingomonas sp.]|uniref:A/G-specific adenine glycosylase n=1 Tax=uncultured Sphingomonas sp. TaxID=158754 RepID=UPI0035C9926D
MDAKRSSVAPALLDWYDRHRRDLPWRAKPGEMPDPYRVWVSEVMLQQTTVATVRPRFTAWVARWPDVGALAAAQEAEVMAAWAGLGYYARARNMHAAAKAVAAAGGFPRTEAELRMLPGLGAYTAAAVAAIAFDERTVVVDANVERVVSRLHAVATPLPRSRPAIRIAADMLTPDMRAGDFAQAVMDLGATVCTPKRPRCLLCPVRGWCDAYATGEPGRYPVKQPRAERPRRHGTAFWLEHGGRVLLHRRPPRGLLGGMLALPTGPWAQEPPGFANAPGATGWRMLPNTVEHGFTHFRLRLALAVGSGAGHEEGEWWPIAALDGAGLPTVFRRAAEALRSGR